MNRLTFCRRQGWGLFILNVFAFCAATAGEDGITFNFTRPLAQGGAFTAVADDFNLFYYNPAGIARLPGRQITALEIAGGLSTDVWRTARYVEDNQETFDDWEKKTIQRSLSQAESTVNDISKFNPRLGVSGDVFSIAGRPRWSKSFHFGMGVFVTAEAKARLDRKYDRFDVPWNNLPADIPWDKIPNDVPWDKLPPVPLEDWDQIRWDILRNIPFEQWPSLPWEQWPNMPWDSLGSGASFPRRADNPPPNAPPNLVRKVEEIASRVPRVTAEINRDLVIPFIAGADIPLPSVIPGRLGAGITTKWIRREQIRRDDSDLDNVDHFRMPAYAKGTGVGLDLGLLYRLTPRATFGLTAMDAFGTKIRFSAVPEADGYRAQPSRSSVFRTQVNAGAAYSPERLFGRIRTKDRFLLTLDVTDLTGSRAPLRFKKGSGWLPRHGFVDHTHVGVEFRRGIFRLGVGLFQGQETAGLGLEDSMLAFSYTFYSRPRSNFLTSNAKEKNHLIALGLRFGATRRGLEEFETKRTEDPFESKRPVFQLPPVSADQGGAGPSHRVYVIQPGDTWERLSKRFYGSERFTQQLRYSNLHIAGDTAGLEPGKKILIPELN